MMTTIVLDSTELFLEDRGRGDVLLLVHGFPLDHSMWTRQIDGLSSDYRVIAPDLRGFGKSRVSDGTIHMSQFADDLAELLSALEITQPVTLCGLSMGGYIAGEFLERHGDQIDRLILCDTRADSDAPAAAEQRRTTAERVIREGSDFLAEEMIEKLFSPAGRQQQENVRAIQRVIRSTAPEAIAAALRGMAERKDMRELLPGITVPSLVICGSEDAITPVGEMREMANSMPGSRFLEVANAGHMAPLENPNTVNAAIREFLRT